MNKYNTYKTIEELAQEIVINKNNSTLLIYANNGTGKTTLSNKIKELYNEQNILCFSSFLKSIFHGHTPVKMLSHVYVYMTQILLFMMQL